MIQVFLSYARSDGLDAATKLRAELAAMGFQLWRDLEEMQGGLGWKEQLRAALRQVQAVLVLLTPAAVTSRTVEWEWESALTLGKRVIGLLILPCDVPADLKRLHYHDLSDPTAYSLGLAKLARDLLRLAATQPAPPASAPPSTSSYVNVTAVNSVIGKDNVVINRGGAGRAEDALRLLAVLQARSSPTDRVSHAALLAVLREIQWDVGQANSRLDLLAVGQAQLLARYDAGEQRILSVLLSRLDAQELALTNAILDALESTDFSAAELDQHLIAVTSALQEIRDKAASIEDSQLALSAGQVAEAIAAPGLDIKHKLKIGFPIIPLVLAYEGEVELSNRMNLEATWEALKGFVRQRWG